MEELLKELQTVLAKYEASVRSDGYHSVISIATEDGNEEVEFQGDITDEAIEYNWYKEI